MSNRCRGSSGSPVGHGLLGQRRRIMVSSLGLRRSPPAAFKGSKGFAHDVFLLKLGFLIYQNTKSLAQPRWFCVRGGKLRHEVDCAMDVCWKGSFEVVGTALVWEKTVRGGIRQVRGGRWWVTGREREGLVHPRERWVPRRRKV